MSRSQSRPAGDGFLGPRADQEDEADVRAKRTVDDAVVADHVARMEAEERAYRLREIREEQA